MKARLKNEKDILHTSRLGKFSPEAARYTSSIELDKRLLGTVVQINRAHVVMLAKQKLIERTAAGALLSALSRIPKDLKQTDELEDVHMNVEAFVISKAGKDIGGMLNLGKSRNDQVATALRIELRKELLFLGIKLVEFEKQLLALAKRHASSIMPGYTHLQRAQPITLGHHLLSYFEALDRDFDRILECFARVNNSPMGAGALASTGLPINEKLVGELLGFDLQLENSLDAVSSRDFATESIYVCSQIMTDLSRISEEIILWTSREFGFAEVPDRFASTSSMMPNKKNPIVAEVARARASQVQADLLGSLSIMRSLPLCYSLDFQELTYNLWSAVDKTADTLDVFAKMFGNIKFNTQRMVEATRSDDYLYATELADYLVTRHHVSFREAHGRVSALVKLCEENLKAEMSPFRALGEKNLSKLLRVRLTEKELEGVLDPIKVLSRRKALGSPNPSLVKKACEKKAALVLLHAKTLEKFEKKIFQSESTLERTIREITASK